DPLIKLINEEFPDQKEKIKRLKLQDATKIQINSSLMRSICIRFALPVAKVFTEFKNTQEFETFLGIVAEHAPVSEDGVADDAAAGGGGGVGGE
ncbi:hypothetical protein K0U07_00285, partial [bacterium]|nr:hypothetical protein [bacterium]